LSGSGLIEWGGFRSEVDGDRLTVGVVGPLEVGAVALGRVLLASTLRLAAPHHTLQHGSFAEEFQLLEFTFEFLKAQPVTLSAAVDGDSFPGIWIR